MQSKSQESSYLYTASCLYVLLLHVVFMHMHIYANVNSQMHKKETLNYGYSVDPPFSLYSNSNLYPSRYRIVGVGSGNSA